MIDSFSESPEKKEYAIEKVLTSLLFELQSDPVDGNSDDSNPGLWQLIFKAQISPLGS